MKGRPFTDKEGLRVRLLEATGLDAFRNVGTKCVITHKDMVRLKGILAKHERKLGKALEMLKEATRRIEHIYGVDTTNNIDADFLVQCRRTITELETVEEQ
jgi:hypothetical protein